MPRRTIRNSASAILSNNGRRRKRIASESGNNSDIHIEPESTLLVGTSGTAPDAKLRLSVRVSCGAECSICRFGIRQAIQIKSGITVPQATPSRSSPLACFVENPESEFESDSL